MDSLQKIIDLANEMLKKADLGREYTMDYVVSRLSKAIDDYPHDSVLNSIAQVISKQVKNGKLVVSQKELYDVYNHFAGINPHSIVKEAIGDLFHSEDNAPKAKVGNETAYTYRSNDNELNFAIEHNPFEGIFDKNKVASYFDPTLAKLGYDAIKDKLNLLGIVPKTISPVASAADAAIVYDVIFTNKLGTVHVPMFVEVEDGIHSPTYFYGNNKMLHLTAENLNSYIVEHATPDAVHDTKIVDALKFSTVHLPMKLNDQITDKLEFFLGGSSMVIPSMTSTVPMPSVLKDLVSYETALLEASASVAPELIKNAKILCARELRDMGYDAQIKLAEVLDNCIVCSAELNSIVGKVAILLPVETVDNNLQMPSLFYSENNKDKMYDFTKAELVKYLTAEKIDNQTILRYSNDFFNMSFNQLKEEIISGAANKDYLRAEEALNRIEDKFGSDYHRAALTDYAKYLTACSADEEAPKHKCRLLIVKGSVEPRCGHYNVPMSRVITNDKGDCELIDRKVKYDNLAESAGTLIRSNKITLT